MIAVFATWFGWSTLSLAAWLGLGRVWASRPTLAKWLWRVMLAGLGLGFAAVLRAAWRADDCVGGSSWLLLPLVSLGLGTAKLVWRRARIRSEHATLREVSAPPFFASLVANFGWERELTWLESPKAHGPHVFDDGRATIVVPPGVAKEPFAEQALAHELAHLIEGDGLWFWLESALGSLLFFHPLVWIARVRARRLTEKSADELVLRRTHCSVGVLRRALVHFAGARLNEPALAFSDTYRELEDRILSMDRYGRTGRASPIALLVTGALLLGAVPAQTAWRAEPEAIAMCVQQPAPGIVDGWMRASRRIVPASSVR